MIAFSIEPDSRYVIAAISGRPDLQEFIASFDQLAAMPGFDASTHRICDMSSAEVGLEEQEFRAFVEQARELPLGAEARTAFVVTDARVRSFVARFVASLARGRFRMFTTLGDAISWVLESDAPVPAADRSRVRVHRLLGDVEPRSVMALQDGWYTHPDFDPQAPVLWDLRRARLHVNVEQLAGLAERMTGASVALRPDGRSAVLVSAAFHEALLESGFEQGVRLGRLRFFWVEDDAYDFLLGGGG